MGIQRQFLLRSPPHFFVAFCISFAGHAIAWDNGVERTPVMGWNPYNAFSCDTNETQYRQAAQNLADLGLVDLGYNYFSLDCGWQGTERNSTGGFTWNTTRFPSGIPALSTFVHDLGLKFGLYSDAGYFSCDFVGGTAGWLGSLGYETQDAESFVSWGADLLKYDNCYSVSPTDFVDNDPPFSLEPHYATMQDALNATGRPVVYSICEWGLQDPARWPASAVGNSWRISNDIGPPASWDNLFRIINEVVPSTGFAGPGGFNDLDLLEIGNEGLTIEEQKTHFAFWAAAKSPLMISTDLTDATNETLGILGNERIIAVNQDSLGLSIAFKRRYTNDYDVWAGPLSDGSTVVVVVNWQNATSIRNLTLNLADVGFSSATVTDLWTDDSLGETAIDSYTTTVASHGSLVLKLTNTTVSPSPSFTYYLVANTTSILSNNATMRTINDSSVEVVGYIGGPDEGTVTLTGIDGGFEDGGSKLLSIDYINADVTQSNTNCSNCRNVYVSVNGGEGVQLQMPLSSGASWDILFEGYLAELDGFVSGTNNTIEFYNGIDGAYAPDLYRVGIATISMGS